MDRRTFIKACGLVMAACLLWDRGVNGGKPACADEEEEPPH